VDLRTHNRIIVLLDWPKYIILKVKHGFQMNRYCSLQNFQKPIIGCWKRDLDKILSRNCKKKSLIPIYRWTRWATSWQPAQFERVGVYHPNVSKLTFQIDWPSRLPIWQRLGLDLDPDLLWWSGTVANTHLLYTASRLQSTEFTDFWPSHLLCSGRL